MALYGIRSCKFQIVESLCAFDSETLLQPLPHIALYSHTFKADKNVKYGNSRHVGHFIFTPDIVYNPMANKEKR
jgi:hypothetical protein